MEEEKRGFRYELRCVIASWFLSIAFDLIPNGKFKNAFSDFIIENIEDL